MANAKVADCKAGAVLIKNGEMWDVLEDWRAGHTVKVRRDDGAVDHIQIGHIGRYTLARPAPDREDLETLPVLADAQDSNRRKVILERHELIRELMT